MGLESEPAAYSPSLDDFNGSEYAAAPLSARGGWGRGVVMMGATQKGELGLNGSSPARRVLIWGFPTCLQRETLDRRIGEGSGGYGFMIEVQGEKEKKRP